nr:TlpA disulfide reductase family protein [uncultured Draconibacterium sp.]
MRKQLKLLVVLTVAIVAACTTREKTPAPTFEKGVAVIQGRVLNPSEESKTIRFAAQGIIESVENTAVIDSNGYFSTKISLYNPQNISGFINDKTIALFVRPGDSLSINIDEKAFADGDYPEYEISGSEPDAGNSLLMQKYMRFIGSRDFNPNTDTSIEEYKAILQTEINRQDSLFQYFCNENEVTSEFKNWAQNDIVYNVANYLLNYHFANPASKGNLFDKTMFPVDNNAAIYSDLYSLHLRHYALNLGIWNDTTCINLLSRGDNLNAFQTCLNTIVNSEAPGLYRDIMCYKMFSSLFGESFSDFSKLFENVDAYIDDASLKEILNDERIEYENEKNVNIAFLDPDSNEERVINGDFWKEIKEKYNGKVVYVDIWATWCAPCLTEFQYTIDLHKKLENKDIAFVNLCLSSKKDNWKAALENSKIDGTNYFFNEEQSQLLRGKLKFEGFPTYLIIDKQGNIVNANAPRPSSGKKIMTLLAEMAS